MKSNQEVLFKYIRQELTLEQANEVETWANADPENRKLLTNLFLVYQAFEDMLLIDRIDTHEALVRLKIKIIRKKKAEKKKRRIKVIRRIAAIILFPLLILAGYLLPRTVTESASHLVNITTNPGVISHFELPDSTLVCLNSGSELTYSSDFSRKNRQVTLCGEGYFNVRKKAMPFEVKIDSTYSVQVFGTTFNVQAYSDEELIKTTLLEGSVQLNYLSESENKEACFLRKNEVSYYQRDKREMRVEIANADIDIAWKDGRIIFDNHPLEEVLQKLGRHYNVDFLVSSNQIYKSSITGTFEKEQLFQVLNYVQEATGIRYKFKKTDTTLNELSKQEVMLYK